MFEDHADGSEFDLGGNAWLMDYENVELGDNFTEGYIAGKFVSIGVGFMRRKCHS